MASDCEVIVSFNVEGLHRWEGANGSVTFLKCFHRHLFHIKMYFPVSDDDREIEILSKRWEAKRYLEGKYGEPCMFGGKSCEMIARELMEQYVCNAVEVLEDGEGGAIVRK